MTLSDSLPLPALLAVIRRIDFELPGCLPILGYGLFKRWRERFGKDTIGELEQALAIIEPVSAVRRPVTRPHYPMVLHRGGYPGGS